MATVISSIEDAAARLKARESGERPRIVGIVGGPGAGKSTIAQAIAELAGPSCVIVPMDGYHLPNEELQRLGRLARKGAPDTFDVPGLVALLERIARGEHVTAPRFDRTIDASVPDAIAVPPGTRTVLVEGNYLLLDGPWAPIGPLLDEAWYLETDDDIRREQLIARHVSFGRSHSEARAWAWDVDERNAMTIAETRARATALLHLHHARPRRADAGSVGRGERP